ncbi:MAG: aerobic carbon-monoxide dehydrogenase small subunit [Frankiales bacterium]|nr:aerobic carbon-monoxide dehydrogenase small subunit [Frankiales bacterium]
MSLSLTVDGVPYEVLDAPDTANLADVLRHHLGLTATKDACYEGRCGSCSVLLGGVLVTACTVLAADVTEPVVTTSGLGSPDAPSDVQRALVEGGGVQCGFCIPGMVVAATDLLERHPDPTEDEVRRGLAGNLCRCTGYGRIVAAVLSAARGRTSP